MAFEAGVALHVGSIIEKLKEQEQRAKGGWQMGSEKQGRGGGCGTKQNYITG